MDFADFKMMFGTDKQCLEYLFHLKWPEGYQCLRCGFKESWEVSPYKYKCKNCGYQSTVTAGTMLQDTHVALTKWFVLAWHMSVHPQLVSPVKIQEELGIRSFHTAQRMILVFQRAMFRPVKEKLQSPVVVDRKSIIWGDKKKAVLIGAETDKGRGLMRLMETSMSSESVYKFIESAVEKGSEVITDLPLSHQQLQKAGYTRRSNSFKSNFFQAEQIAHNLQSEIDEFNPTISFEEYLKFFEIKHNSSKIPMGFDELLQQIIRIGPVPRRSVSVEKEKSPISYRAYRGEMYMDLYSKIKKE